MTLTHDIRESKVVPGQWNAAIFRDDGLIITGSFRSYTLALEWIRLVREDIEEDSDQDETPLEPTEPDDLFAPVLGGES